MILVDAGNTRVKLAVASGNTTLEVATFANTDDALEAHIAAWVAARSRHLEPHDGAHRGAHEGAHGNAPDLAFVAAVAVPGIVARIELGLRAARPALAIETVATRAELLGFRIAYEDPSRLGVDRFVAMLGLWLEGAAPFVLVSAGTALVIDAVGANGQHRGGLIAPSPTAMQAAVLGATARVRVERAGVVADFGRSTEDGLASGAWHAAAALVERATARATAAFGKTPQLVLTGGDASTLATLIDSPHVHRGDAVLRGLAAYAEARQRGRILPASTSPLNLRMS